MKIIIILFIVIIIYLLTNVPGHSCKNVPERFDNRSIASYPQFKPLASFVYAARSLETTNKKYKTIKHNTLTIFNQFVQNDYSNLIKYNSKNLTKYNYTNLTKFNTHININNILKKIENNITTHAITFLNSNNYEIYTNKYLKNVYFIKIRCKIIDRDVQSSNYLKQASIKAIPIDLYIAEINGDILYISVNGYIIEKEILRYSTPKSNNYYYPAQLFNSNLDNPNEFGGYALITPDKESLKKFCEQRRKELNNYSYCKLNKVKENGDYEIVYDQIVDEIKCIENGGEIVRINTPKFGLLFDNTDSIAEDINGNIEINDIYLSESDPCADLSKFDNEFNNLFEHERKYNKIKSF
ncbi:MAG: hypothetical protein IJ997_02105 [Mycoplasmataceae bacterium]|nr:hypothetical protein [Mycoplasmataceae bacterium]